MQCLSQGYSYNSFTPIPTNFRIVIFITTILVDTNNENAAEAKRSLDLTIKTAIKSN